MGFLKTFVLAVLVGVGGCGESQTTMQTANTFQKIESADECHLCGMVIEPFPGPKAELFEPVDGKPVARKFCSTRDMLAYYFQPENRHNVLEIYVHDMAQASWEHPGNEHLIDARKAWFVAGSSRQAAMGMTLASFATEADAESFSKEFGGRILAFDQLELNALQDGSAMEPAHHAH